MARRFLLALLLMGVPVAAMAAEPGVREKIAEAMVMTDPDAQQAAVRALVTGGEETLTCFRAWKEGEIYIYEADDGTRTAVVFTGGKDENDAQAMNRYGDGSPLLDPMGNPLRASTSDLEIADTDSGLRLAMKEVSDSVTLMNPDEDRRMHAVEEVGFSQDSEILPVLKTMREKETVSRVKRSLDQSIALIELRSESPEVQIAAANRLGELQSIPSQDALKTIKREAEAANKPEVAAAAENALTQIAAHVQRVNTAETVFRGVSSGSVLLIVAIGLAITFGLMGIINMAHGELIAVGAYTTYLIQNIFGDGISLSPFGMSIHIPGMGLTGSAASWYFVCAIPCSFLTAALVGIGLERSVIRFLYRRPLESLLATWGVSLVMQQLFRLIFGPNNVQVSSPVWLAGNWTVNDVQFGWTRLFVVGFAILIIAGTTLVLRKTSLGLLIRAVMQNRGMAACMGVRTERVNVLTFGFGSGLAGLAGAFISQIGNVGPGLGQNYIVDAFMTVVVGGVGNIAGTVVSALGIGMIDQTLQQVLGNPVIGRILVLGAIILFLQFRPAGLFVTRSRSLEN